jgi:hypothetical protein
LGHSVPTQDILSYSTSPSGEKIVKLWYLPHITEIMLSGGLEKSSKVNSSLEQVIFRNPKIFTKSAAIYMLIYEIYWMVSMYAKILISNQRLAGNASKIREADYIVNIMTQIKRDLLLQGSSADYDRVRAYLHGKWHFWYLKWKLTVSTALFEIEMFCNPEDVRSLRQEFDTFVMGRLNIVTSSGENTVYYNSRSLLSMPQTRMTISTNYLPSSNIFAFLSPKAKSIANTKAALCDETLEDFKQTVQFSAREEVKNKQIIEFLTSKIRLLSLRREFLRFNMHHMFPLNVTHTYTE